MACLIVKLPRELQLYIYGLSEDLDDAQYLSQTCRNLYGVYVSYQKIIERTIIMSSHVYDFDLQLSYLLRVNEDVKSYFLSPKITSPANNNTWPFELLLAAVTAAFETEMIDDRLTDEDIDTITMRWRQMGYLRDLYLDDVLSKEFDLFCARFAANLSKEVRAVIVEPGLIKFSTSSSRLKQSRRFKSDFKAGFYKCLCVHSIAIAGLQLAKIAPDFNVSSVNEHHETLSRNAISAWAKRTITVGSKRVCPGWEVQLDCLEVFDFLYMFLLRKLLPLESLDSWTSEDAEAWPYSRRRLEAGPSRTEKWYNLLEHSRWVLKPQDIFDLIRHQVWRADTTYPPNKSTYMWDRGMFHHSYYDGPGFTPSSTRGLMVQELCPEQEWRYSKTERRCWWDRVRVLCGSPFLPEAAPRFEVEMAKFQRLHRERIAKREQEAEALWSALPTERTKSAKEDKTEDKTEETTETPGNQFAD